MLRFLSIAMISLRYAWWLVLIQSANLELASLPSNATAQQCQTRSVGS